jgi:3-oxoacid CoA-transferase
VSNGSLVQEYVLGMEHQLIHSSPLKDIRAATAQFKASESDVLISVGGGSPIDSAKAIAYFFHEETGEWIPSIAVPTTLSVAETTQNAGFTTDEGHKMAVSDEELVPKGTFRRSIS